VKIKKISWLIYTILFGALSWSASLIAQVQIDATVLKRNENGSYIVVIGGDTLLAITKEMSKKSLIVKTELDAARKNIVLKDTMIATLERLETSYKEVHKKQIDYIADLDSLVIGYKKLAKGYKRLSGEPWVTFSGGIGASGGNEEPFVLAGLGIRRFRVWALLQESNAGAAIGLTFPIF
jgi:hypothetical protein